MQVLPSIHPILRESPPAILVLHQEIETPVQLPTQTLQVVGPIRLCHSRHRPLNLYPLQLPPLSLSYPRLTRHSLAILVCVTNRCIVDNVLAFSIPNQRLYCILRLGCLVAHKHFVVPSFLPICGIDADVSRSAFARPDLSFPFFVAGRAFLVVEVTRKRQR